VVEQQGPPIIVSGNVNPDCPFMNYSHIVRCENLAKSLYEAIIFAIDNYSKLSKDAQEYSKLLLKKFTWEESTKHILDSIKSI